MCFYGSDEKDSACPSLDPARVELVKLPGAHHFGGDYGTLAEMILKRAEVGPTPEKP